MILNMGKELDGASVYLLATRASRALSKKEI